jgi:glutamine synthetase
MTMAGLDGIRNKIDPGEPMDVDLYELPPSKAAKVKQVPGSLDAALKALEADHKFLFEGGVFTEDIIETWIETKTKKDVDYIRLRPHPSEFYLYYDV